MSTVTAPAHLGGAAIDVLSARLMGPRLAGLLAPHGAGGSPRCHVVDAKHDLEGRWAVLYELDGRLVLGLADDARRSPDSHNVRAFAFPDDPALAGLAAVVDGEAMRETLADALPEVRGGDARIVRCRVTPLRYRPLRRCTLKVEVALAERTTENIRRKVLFAKLYHDVEKARSVYEEMRALHAASALHGVRVASPAGFVADLALVLQDAVPGQPLDAVLTAAGGRPRGGASWLEGPLSSAAAGLAALHAARLPSGRPRPIGPRVERMVLRAAQVERIDAALGGRMRRLAEAARSTLTDVSPAAGELCLIHGDCKPSQFLVHGPEIGLIDFDHSGRADPACDVGDFLASLRKLTLGRHVTPFARSRLRRLEERFLDAYLKHADSTPGFEERVGWYLCVALQRKAFRAFQRSPRSPLPELLIEEAERSEGRLPKAGRR